MNPRDAVNARDAVLAQLDALIEATPPPPPGDEPDAVLDAFAAIARDRAEILAELATQEAQVAGDPQVRARHATIAARDRSWLDALGRAQQAVDTRLNALRRTRSYRR